MDAYYIEGDLEFQKFDPNSVEAVQPYTVHEHSGQYLKFVCWREANIVVVSPGRHQHTQIVAFARQTKLVATPSSCHPDGAGSITWSGFIDTWLSIGYDLTTPLDLRALILEDLSVKEQKEKLDDKR